MDKKKKIMAGAGAAVIILAGAAFFLTGKGTKGGQGYAILVREEFSCLEFIMNRDTINWILK